MTGLVMHARAWGCPRETPTSQDDAVPDAGVGADAHVAHHVGAGRDEHALALDGQHDLGQPPRSSRTGVQAGGQVHHLAALGRVGGIQLARRPGQVGLDCRGGGGRCAGGVRAWHYCGRALERGADGWMGCMGGVHR